MFRRLSKIGAVRLAGTLLGTVLLALNISIGVEWYVLAINAAFILAMLFEPARLPWKG